MALWLLLLSSGVWLVRMKAWHDIWRSYRDMNQFHIALGGIIMEEPDKEWASQM